MTEILAKLLPLGLVLLMFVVGLRLDGRQLTGIFARPRGLLTGLAVQWLGLPVLAILLGTALNLPGPMWAGLVLIALAPGGVTSNYIAHLAKADLALSTAMTLVTTALAGITIPLGLAITGAAVLPDGASLIAISAKMSVVVVVPAALGLALTTWAPRASEFLLKGLEPASKLIFAAMVLATFIQNWDAMMAHLGVVGVAVISLTLGALALAAGAGRVMALSFTRTRAIMVEASLQNVAVALFVAGALLQEPALSVPALIYAVIMNLTALVQIVLGRRDDTGGQPQGA